MWSALLAPGPSPALRRERLISPDQDFIDIDYGPAAQTSDSPLWVLFHGLEGSSRSHYARAILDRACRLGWLGAVVHFRGCSGELNLRPRAYHSGDSEEIDWILRRLHEAHPGRPLFATGVSLGGNALLRWAQEAGQQACGVVRSIAAVCAPIDLAASGHAMGTGFNRWTYTPMFCGP